jgi:HSP20 family protein
LPRKSTINLAKETHMATRFLAPYSRGLRTYDPLLDLHREMNRLFDDVFGVNAGSGGSGMAAYASAPRLDMHESEQELTVEAELPGVDRADLDVRLDGDVLTISGEKRSRRDDKQHNAHLSECSYGRFQRSVQLPFRPEGDDVQAEFEGRRAEAARAQTPRGDAGQPSYRGEVRPAVAAGRRLVRRRERRPGDDLGDERRPPVFGDRQGSDLLVGIDGPLLRIDDDLEGDDARKHVDEPLTAAQPQAQARATRLASGSPA